MTKPRFSTRLLHWFDQYGRKDLPWQRDRTPYHVWVSEIMLQQTQVATVIPYYQRFIERFPDVKTLAAADLDEVLHLWSGLGYYARGRNLHKAARYITEQLHGEFPENYEQLLALPGIGRSTAGAVLAQAFEQRYAILDGNVKRVLARYIALPGWPGQTQYSDQLWQLAESLTPRSRIADYTQAIMDLGALLCTRSKPNCAVCPVNQDCQAYRQGNPDAYPVKKPKQSIPTRSVKMILLRGQDGRLLLQRRPPAGIWGGLLSFPELELERDVVLWCKENVGSVQSLQQLQPLTHTFSHFRLQIQPVSATIHQPLPCVMEDTGWVWFTPGESIAGLAAPVSKLIQQLQHKQAELEFVD